MFTEQMYAAICMKNVTSGSEFGPLERSFSTS